MRKWELADYMGKESYVSGKWRVRLVNDNTINVIETIDKMNSKLSVIRFDWFGVHLPTKHNFPKYVIAKIEELANK